MQAPIINIINEVESFKEARLWKIESKLGHLGLPIRRKAA